MSREFLLLKWGTLKGCGGLQDNPAAKDALRRYLAGPTSISAMAQHDTDSQKQALCDLIDAVNCEIHNDWSGDVMSKDEAKKYVREYDE